ncbi:universal stress protein [Sphingorhabdus sp.]
MALEASTLVMGAYGHSRAREFLFGGVTRSLLRDCPLPLLLAR